MAIAIPARQLPAPLLVSHLSQLFRLPHFPFLPHTHISVLSNLDRTSVINLIITVPHSVHHTRLLYSFIYVQETLLPQTVLLKSSSQYCCKIWYGKTRTIRLSDHVKSLTSVTTRFDTIHTTACMHFHIICLDFLHLSVLLAYFPLHLRFPLHFCVVLVSIVDIASCQSVFVHTVKICIA